MEFANLPEFLVIRDNSEFAGSFDQLKKITEQYTNAKWRRLGPAYAIQAEGEGFTDVWWPDTSDFLTIDHMARPVSLARMSRLDWRPKRALEKKNGKPCKWSRFDFSGMKGISLPELFFRDFFGFLYGMAHATGPGVGPTEAELAEVMDKAVGVRIPKDAPANSVVTIDFTPDSRLSGIAVGPVPKVPRRGRGSRYLTNRIDMLELVLDEDDLDGVRQSISLLTAVLDGNAARAWPRERCEAFFNDDRNFWPCTKPCQKGYSIFRKLPSARQ